MAEKNKANYIVLRDAYCVYFSRRHCRWFEKKLFGNIIRLQTQDKRLIAHGRKDADLFKVKVAQSAMF